EATGGEDLALAPNRFGAGPDHDGDVGLDVWIAGLADGGDLFVLDPDVGLHDAPMVEDERVGGDGVGRALLFAGLGLTHARADHLAAAELHLLAIGREILFDFDDEIGVGESYAIAGGRTEHVGVDAARHRRAHGYARYGQVRIARRRAACCIFKASPSRPRESRRFCACRRALRASHRASVRARTALPFQPRYRAACRAPSCGRTRALDWFRKSGSASPPGSAGRRCW